ncbi:MAG: HAD-IA family hydrolase [Saprospiraceae bacterium]|nr:HAD-IA family hydrolase [Saprospiraceae bacterium]MBK8634801.1 HAD-IA family hydrolase [Saprospiraceae bacterium]HMS70102.1 HAD-IA family hydrolase [Saprospiraceae bacterium]
MTLSEILALIPHGTQGLIFDLDGTLADTMPIHIQAWERTGDHFGVPITGDLVNEYAGAPSHEVLKSWNDRFGWNVDIQEGKEMKTSLYYELLDELGHVEPIQLVYDVMVHYYGSLPMSIGTGSNKYSASRVIKMIGADKFIKDVVSADDVTNHKPYPETFLKCAELMNVDATKCLVFEDGPMGVMAAQNANMRTIYLPEFELI